MSSWAETTHMSYNVYLAKFTKYCSDKQIQPHEGTVEHGIQFLHNLYKEGKKYGYIAAPRSALSAVLPKRDGLSFGKDELVTKFLKGIFRERPQLPRYVQIYDPNIILEYANSLPANHELLLEQLSKKLATLLMLLSGQRGQTLPLIRTECNVQN